MKKIACLIILISFVVGLYLYSQMPEQMASHWNASGEVDGYMSKFWGLFLMPIVLIGMLLLLWLVPKIDPLKKNVEKFKKYFDIFILLITLFLFYIHLLTLGWNLGYTFNMTRLMVPAMAILFFYIGILVEKAKRNWFIGIRTPWTLSSDIVWDKTHKITGKLFKIAAVISLLGMIDNKYSIWFLLVPIFAVVIYSFIYSYVEYKKIKA